MTTALYITTYDSTPVRNGPGSHGSVLKKLVNGQWVYANLNSKGIVVQVWTGLEAPPLHPFDSPYEQPPWVQIVGPAQLVDPNTLNYKDYGQKGYVEFSHLAPYEEGGDQPRNFTIHIPPKGEGPATITEV